MAAIRKKDVEVGAIYVMKVSGALTHVRIDEVYVARGYKQDRTHWRGTNLRTGREVMVRSAAKLRSKVTTP